MKWLFILMVFGFNIHAEKLTTGQATQLDGMLTQKALSVCEKLSQETFTRFKNDPKRVKDFIDPDPKVIKITCAFSFKEEAQNCARSFLKNMDKVTAKTKDKILEQGKPHQIEFESCLRKTETLIKEKLEKAATDKSTAESLINFANKKVESRSK